MGEFTREELQGIAEKAEKLSKLQYLPYQEPPGERRAYERLADAANFLDYIMEKGRRICQES